MLEQLKRDVSIAERIKDFVANPFCLARLKTQPTLSAFLKYLPTWHSIRYS